MRSVRAVSGRRRHNLGRAGSIECVQDGGCIRQVCESSHLRNVHRLHVRIIFHSHDCITSDYRPLNAPVSVQTRT